MTLESKIIIISILTILYCAYFVELHRHLTHPLNKLGYQSRQKKTSRLILFFIGIIATIALAYLIRKLILPKAIFDLIVASIQAIFILPFLGAIVTDRLLHTWKERRLPYPITILTIICSIAIVIVSNTLILFGSQDIIEQATYLISVGSDIISVCFIIGFAFFGLGYASSLIK